MTRGAGPAGQPGLPDDLTDEEREVVARVVQILRRLRYGTVLLIVQDGKVVQIEMAEKFRLR
ncbi:MAG TPA: YezD family protein [Actinomycetota bacterium]|nr:YezD family protein [Actinomycetota bacterium]